MTALAELVPEMEMPVALVFTDSAAAKVADLIAEEGNPDLKLRVFVQGGGCSGFQYGFKFDESPAEDDDVILFSDFAILLDSLSYPYLFGSSLDYVEDLSGSKFIITNPNAKTTCGCGESFTV